MLNILFAEFPSLGNVNGGHLNEMGGSAVFHVNSRKIGTVKLEFNSSLNNGL